MFDVTAELDGYVADAAVTVALPPVVPLNVDLRDCAQFAFGRAVSVARAGRPINKIGRVVQTAVHRRGFTVLTELSSHRVGRAIHEPPTIPNYHDPRPTTSTSSSSLKGAR